MAEQTFEIEVPSETIDSMISGLTTLRTLPAKLADNAAQRAVLARGINGLKAKINRVSEEIAETEQQIAETERLLAARVMMTPELIESIERIAAGTAREVAYQFMQS